VAVDCLRTLFPWSGTMSADRMDSWGKREEEGQSLSREAFPRQGWVGIRQSKWSCLYYTTTHHLSCVSCTPGSLLAPVGGALTAKEIRRRALAFYSEAPTEKTFQNAMQDCSKWAPPLVRSRCLERPPCPHGTSCQHLKSWELTEAGIVEHF
jgi:hypothetical protein